MEKSKQVEQIAEIVKESLKDLLTFPKMYHPSEDQINLGLIIDGKKITIEIKGIS
jgi:hypothetical protein